MFVVVWHRNHIGVLSGQPLINNYGILTHDFTSDSSHYYGSGAACKQLADGLWGLSSGDANGDGEISELDKIQWKLEAGANIYGSSDFNMDGQVNNKDINDFWIDNISMDCQVPE